MADELPALGVVLSHNFLDLDPGDLNIVNLHPVRRTADVSVVAEDFGCLTIAQDDLEPTDVHLILTRIDVDAHDVHTFLVRHLVEELLARELKVLLELQIVSPAELRQLLQLEDRFLLSGSG